MKHAREWVEGGDKVKATIWFRGREMTHRELGARILEKLERDLIDVGEVEARPRMEGNQMFIIFGPKRHKTAIKHEPVSPRPEAAAKPASPAAKAEPEPARATSPQPDAG